MIHLVTGGAGFIGSNLLRVLLARGEEVIAFDNLVRGSQAHFGDLRRNNRFCFEKVDCADLESFRATIAHNLGNRQAAAIWHMAANSDIPAGIADPYIDLRDTFITTFNTVLVMREFGIPEIHFASSSAIYGDFGEHAISEDSAPCKPISNYGAMKLASEAQICAALEAHAGRASIFRFPNVVGAPATHGAIFDFVGKLRSDPLHLEVLGDGSQRKAYLHVTDLVDAMLFIAEKGNDKINIYNIGPNDDGVTVQFIAERVRDAVSPQAQIIYGKGNRGWVGDVPKFRYATHRLAKLGWEPKLGSEEAIRIAIRDIVRQI
jgi:UDP-glucose 4-epimerase